MFLLTLTMTAMAQREVTKFLGIPVDGSKTEMIKKLKAKGFRSDPKKIWDLVGDFNGREVYVSIVTHKNKVWRIALEDVVTSSKSQIRIRFNELCRQFTENPKYMPMTSTDQTISEDEDVSLQLALNKKQYEAGFLQFPDDWKKKIFGLDDSIESKDSDAFKAYLESGSNRLVWFCISRSYLSTDYVIVMYYDNEYNKAKGEDL